MATADDDEIGEAAIDAKEAQLFGGSADSDRYSSMYYPRYLPSYYLNSSQFDVIVPCDAKRHSACIMMCSQCGKLIDHDPRYLFAKDRAYCTACLLKLGVSTTSFLPFDIVATIVSFFPEYVHVARAARVSKMWFQIVNVDKWRETPMMGYKRYWLARAIYLGKRFSLENNRAVNPKLTAFQNQLEYGQWMGEWQDRLDEYRDVGSLTEDQRRKMLRLVLRLATTPFNQKRLGVECLDSDKIWSLSTTSIGGSKDTIATDKLTLQFNPLTKKGSVHYLDSKIVASIDGSDESCGLMIEVDSGRIGCRSCSVA